MEENESQRRIEAVVFDLDGLVFNTEHVFHAAGEELLRRRGMEMPEDLHRTMMGRRAEEAYPILVERMGLSDTVEEIVLETRSIFFDLLDDVLQPMPGLFELLDLVESRGLPKAIATSSRRAYLEDLLGRYELTERFSLLLSSEDVTQGKPNPEIYLKAAERLGVSASRMLVFEDSENGSRAAAAAGAVTVSVPHEHSRTMDFSMATHVVEGLGDPVIRRLLATAD